MGIFNLVFHILGATRSLVCANGSDGGPWWRRDLCRGAGSSRLAAGMRHQAAWHGHRPVGTCVFNPLEAAEEAGGGGGRTESGGVQGGPPIHPTQEGRVRHSSPVPACSFCMHKMAAEARRSIWNPGEGELRKWPPER